MKNLFSKVLEKVLGEGGETFEITCAADWANVPVGFFKTAAGLGYKSKSIGIMLPVGETVLDGANRVTRDPQVKLPHVVLNYASASAPGMQRVGDTNLLDSDSLNGEWDGAVQYEGDSSLGKLNNEQLDRLDFGLWR